MNEAANAANAYIELTFRDGWHFGPTIVRHLGPESCGLWVCLFQGMWQWSSRKGSMKHCIANTKPSKR